MALNPPKKLHLFNSSLVSSQYVFKDGNKAIFTKGLYATDNPEYIAELNNEVAKGNPYISVDPNRITAMSDEISPMDLLRKRMKEEILAEMAAATAGTKDMGTSTQGPTNVATTKTIGDVAAGSASGTPGIAASAIKVASATK